MRYTLASLFVLILTACASVGPQTVERDRVDYGSALSRSLQEQTVLNIVKSRYADWPSFLDVNQIVAGYSREATASLTLDWLPNDSSSNTIEPGLSGTFTESPTITFTPLVGADFATTLLEPLDVEAILAVAYSGGRIDRLFELTVNSINGKRNAQFVGDDLQPADPEFWRILDLLRDLQRSDAWGLRRSQSAPSHTKTSDKAASKASDASNTSKETLRLILRPLEESPETEKQEALRNALGLDPDADSYQVVYGGRAIDTHTLAIESRTLWEVLWELQRFVEVPPEDVAAGFVSELAPVGETRSPALRIQSGTAPPPRAFVAVPYRGRWFWIDDDDITSKHTLSAVLMMSTLARTDSADPPRLVIPTR